MHNRLARLRPVPQELDRPRRCVEGGFGDALRPVDGKVTNYALIHTLSTPPLHSPYTDDLIRKYPEVKLQENIDAEIMEVLLQEAKDSYDENIVVVLTSNTSEEMDVNVDRIEAWLKQWKKDNAPSS